VRVNALQARRKCSKKILNIAENVSSGAVSQVSIFQVSDFRKFEVYNFNCSPRELE
jgi:hypothetical protein